MLWTESHNFALEREIIQFKPWFHRHGTPEHGQIWNRIAESLNQIQEPCFKVDNRSVRDHYKLIEKRLNKKISNEEKAIGIAPPEESALDQGIHSIIEKFHDFDPKCMEEKHQKDLKTNKDTEIAEEFRKAWLETFGETKRRLAASWNGGWFHISKAEEKKICFWNILILAREKWTRISHEERRIGN